MSLHDYRCSGDCGPCGGIGGIGDHRCLTCGGDGKCIGCAPADGVVFPEAIARGTSAVLSAAYAWRYDIGKPHELVSALDELAEIEHLPTPSRMGMTGEAG